jgi:EAL domain-containing protein (putative c-di-GMP-specific phosphodiesterase class I)/GGDEF domain-containing protein
MPVSGLADALPDLAVLIRRDGTILDHMGGRALVALSLADDCAGKQLDIVWPEPLCAALKQLVRSAIARRTTVEASLRHAGATYEVRASAQGPDRAICVIRPALGREMPEDPLATTSEMVRPQFDRRGFMRRLWETMSRAALHERPAAIAVIHLEGIAGIASAIDFSLSERVLRAALLRMPGDFGCDSECSWYLGQLSETSLALVMENANRDTIGALTEQVCASLREPIAIGEDSFHVTPYPGVALLGQDAASPRNLLDHARVASAEAQRSGSQRPIFFSEALKVRSLQRLDMARELREAIADRLFRLRYVGRHELVTGRLVGRAAYLRWEHPLRGEVRPAEFLSVAESTGLAIALSRAALSNLRDDFAAMRPQLGVDARISFGPLRHHLLQDDFIDDIGRFLADGAMPAGRLEIRIAERTFVALNPSVCRALRKLGVQIVVDELGRGLGSLDKLARAPIFGVQLDRAWVTAIQDDAVAAKVCRAEICAATALGLTPIATGIDDERQRSALLELGCGQGSGDLYREVTRQFDRAVM